MSQPRTPGAGSFSAAGRPLPWRPEAPPSHDAPKCLRAWANVPKEQNHAGGAPLGSRPREPQDALTPVAEPASQGEGDARQARTPGQVRRAGQKQGRGGGPEDAQTLKRTQAAGAERKGLWIEMGYTGPEHADPGWGTLEQTQSLRQVTKRRHRDGREGIVCISEQRVCRGKLR